jgi:hypothetical protein
MFSCAWVETPTTLLFNEASVYNAADQVVSNNVFMGMLEDLPEYGPETVATPHATASSLGRTGPWNTPRGIQADNGKEDYTLEIYDQLRPLGRILEHFMAGIQADNGHTDTHG